MVDAHERALAIPGRGVGLPAPETWGTMRDMAGVFIQSGLLPSTLKTPEAVLVVMMKGSELGIPPLYALSNIVVVQGKPTCSAELMLALIYRDQGDLAVIVEESTAEVCRVAYRRRGWDRARAFAFTIADAQTAGLAGKGTWALYPQAMLRARCISAVARLAFPDSIAGMYLPEELGATVRVGEDGAVEVESLPPPANGSASAPAPNERARAIAAAMDAAVAEADAGIEPVTDETRIACAAFVDAVQAANPKVRPKLPPDDAGDAVWRAWLARKSAEWATSPHNPNAAQPAAAV